jgi:hypothetical protein
LLLCSVRFFGLNILNHIERLQMQNVLLEDDPKRIEWFRTVFPDIVVTQTPEECLWALDNDTDILFLDHDLLGRQFVPSDDPFTGMELVRRLLELPQKPRIREIIIHSCNPSGVANMMGGLYGLYKVRRLSFPLLQAAFEKFNMFE